MVPRVVELGRQPDLAAGHAGRFDALPDLGFVAVRERGVDVAVALLQGGRDGFAHFVGLALPGTEAEGGDLRAGVEGEGLSGGWESVAVFL